MFRILRCKKHSAGQSDQRTRSALSSGRQNVFERLKAKFFNKPENRKANFSVHAKEPPVLHRVAHKAPPRKPSACGWRLLKLLEKNFRLLWKSKLFILTILLGPLLIALLLGMAFNNTDIYSLNIGVYVEKTDQLEEMIIGKLRENFKVLTYQNKDACIDSIKEYITHICIILPETISLEGNDINEILFYVDDSRTNLVWMILDTLSTIFSRSSSEIATNLTSELLYKLDFIGENSASSQTIITNLENNNNNRVGLMKQIELNTNNLPLIQSLTNVEDSLNKNRKLKEELYALIDDINEGIMKSEDSLDEIKTGDDAALQSQLDTIEQQLTSMKNILSESSVQRKADELNSLLIKLDTYIFTIQQIIDENKKKREAIKLSFGEDAVNLKKVDSFTDEINSLATHLRITNPAKIAEPLITEIRPINIEKTHFSFIFPTLLMLIIVFTAIILSSSLIVIEHKSKAFFRNYMSPTSPLFFLFTYFVTDLIIITANLSIFLIISKVLFNIDITLSLFMILFFIMSLFILLGSIIGCLIKSEQSNMALGITVSSVFLFFSNTILPIESIPQTLREIIKYNPFVIGETVIRKLLVYKSGLLDLTSEILIILIYILIFVAILVLIPKRKLL